MSINMLKGFEFKKKETLIHSLDPRTKLIIVVCYTILSLSFVSIIPLALLVITLLPFFILAKTVTRWKDSLRGLAFILLLILFMNTVFNSFDFAISMCLRLVLLMSAFSIFFMTVHPDEFSQSLLAMKVPFSFTFTFSLATRFIPTLAMEAQSIIDAQRSRGLELEGGNLIRRVKNMIPIIIPLVINSIKKALSIAEALESKAFGAVKKRTNYFQLKMKQLDYLLVFCIVGVTAITLALHLTGFLPPFIYFHLPF